MLRTGFIFACFYCVMITAQSCQAGKSEPPDSVQSNDPSASNADENGPAQLTLKSAKSFLTASTSFSLLNLEVQIVPDSLNILLDSDRHPTNPELDVWTPVALPAGFKLDLQDLESSQTADVEIPSGDIIGISFQFAQDIKFKREGSGCETETSSSEPFTVFLFSKDKGSKETSLADVYVVDSSQPPKFWDLATAIYSKTHELAGYSKIITGELPITNASPNGPVTISVGLIDIPDYANSCESPPPVLDFTVMATPQDEFITGSREDRNAYLTTSDTGLDQVTVYRSFCQFGFLYEMQADQFAKTMQWTTKKYNSIDCSDSTPNWTMTANANYSLNYSNLFASQFVRIPTTVTSMSLRAQAAAEVTQFNNLTVCGFADWVLDTTKTVSDCEANLRIENGGSIGFVVGNTYQSMAGLFIPNGATEIDILFDHENNLGQYSRVTLYSDLDIVQPPSCPTIGLGLTCNKE